MGSCSSGQASISIELDGHVRVSAEPWPIQKRKTMNRIDIVSPNREHMNGVWGNSAELGEV